MLRCNSENLLVLSIDHNNHSKKKTSTAVISSTYPVKTKERVFVHSDKIEDTFSEGANKRAEREDPEIGPSING